VIRLRRVRVVGHVTRLGDVRNAQNNLVGKPEGKRPLGRRGHKWEDIIRMYLGGKGWVFTGFIWLRIGTIDGFCEHGNETSGSIKFW
jgi:hypothetical protein